MMMVSTLYHKLDLFGKSQIMCLGKMVKNMLALCRNTEVLSCKAVFCQHENLCVLVHVFVKRESFCDFNMSASIVQEVVNNKKLRVIKVNKAVIFVLTSFLVPSIQVRELCSWGRKVHVP